ncbi:Sporozoite developmental protein, putative [Perkinsus marinus ATCC 50983]|uniref:Sporozoite developmental protein, putative n=1 Tax=Perkinsus marinus (strain ATCC 50983 / TXsc) TaxID=423536 RepID=C5LBV1_PERM5|nr:Sporozoite developmental protein, putative [Perkinsus marinus ATCC 50983]EER05922.1 Sporozoite developmental protein, putative [Perkinsus marinus ATCC 50983]|eukprot:XP_002774106.1 Sporozoite developmental protein, putative [Perkinsus marinus ATCC 50983]
MATIIATADAIQKPDTDYRQYRAITLPNNMQALLIHDPKTEKAAACMAVKVGSMFDPPQFQGIAHFLEHMLFLGTQKYPEEDSYNKFLAQNGGRSNAFTSDTNTVYFFTVNSSALDGALDRFSYFFKEPLFTQSATDREVQAVNSENSKNLQVDVWRMMQLERELVFNKEHPSYHFGTGNKETLKQIPRDALLDFHNKWYSSNIMKLAVIGNESLEELQESVLEKFSPVLNKNVYIPVDAEFGDASFLREIGRSLSDGVTHVDHVASAARGLVSFVVPIKEIRQVDFAFFMPTQSPLWTTKPARYLSHIFGHEGEGSLLSALKAQGLATGLSAGAVYDTAGLSVFKISVAIPNSAFQNAGNPWT